jgi:hypothetical protein
MVNSAAGFRTFQERSRGEKSFESFQVLAMFALEQAIALGNDLRRDRVSAY